MTTSGTSPSRLVRVAKTWACSFGRLLRFVLPKLGRLLDAVLPLALISYGAFLVYPPAGFFVPGLLWWIDSYVPPARRKVELTVAPADEER